jgi:lipopolysaccharide/colanic/teichoic acid biosynthesis glycosyltransferase
MAAPWIVPHFESKILRDASTVLPEPAFLRALCVERKRAERSGKAFVLMLLSQGGSSGKHNGHDVFGKAAAAVMSSMRETDLAGWHAKDQVFGVIFAELGTADRQSAIAALGARIATALRSMLGPDQLHRLHIAFHYFPEDQGNGGHDGPMIAPLYPDLARRDEVRRVPRALKRAIDMLGSVAGLIFLSPLLLAIAMAIKCSSPGPVLFRQQRIGQHGVPFTFLKFRSMYAPNDSQLHRDFVTQSINGHTRPPGAGQNGHAVYKITDDPRVTRIGLFLRRSSLDELPQLLNVLKGEMSLVGPRPPIPYELEAYHPWHRRRVLEARPGITGLWQVNGRSRLPFADMVRLDLQYAQRWSLWLDLKILLRTPRAVLSGDGAY